MDNNIDFIEFVKKNCPKVSKSYERSKIPFDNLELETVLKSVVGGFGGGPGQILVVVNDIKVGVDGIRYVELKKMHDFKKSTYILYEKDPSDGRPWYNMALIIDDWEKYRLMSGGEKNDWIFDKLGVTLESYSGEKDLAPYR